MSINMSINKGGEYGRYYKNTNSISSCGTGVHSRDEKKLPAYKPGLNSQDVQNVIVELSSNGIAALMKNKNPDKNGIPESDPAAKAARQEAFDQEIVQLSGPEALDLPEFSGLVSADLAIAAVTENCSKEDRMFVYSIIRGNFLMQNASDITEEERQAKISLGMKKAEYAANQFIPEDQKDTFLSSMESIANLASAGKRQEDGRMDYGIAKRHYLGHGSSMVETGADPLDLMRRTDNKAYEEYLKIGKTGTDEERELNSLRYLSQWTSYAYKNGLFQNYDEKEVYQYVVDIEKNHQRKDYFKDVNTVCRSAFLDSLAGMQDSFGNFLSSLIRKELSSSYWKTVTE